MGKGWSGHGCRCEWNDCRIGSGGPWGSDDAPSTVFDLFVKLRVGKSREPVAHLSGFFVGFVLGAVALGVVPARHVLVDQVGSLGGR